MINTYVNVWATSTEVLNLTWTNWATTIVLWNESISDISLAIWWDDAVLWSWIVLSPWSQIIFDTADTQINIINAISDWADKKLTVTADISTPWEIVLINNSISLTDLKLDWVYASNSDSYEITLDWWTTWENIWNVNTYSNTLASWNTYNIYVRWVKWWNNQIKWAVSNLVSVDITAPTMLSAVKDLVTQITLTLSELALASTTTKANNWWFTVFQTGTPTTTYAVSSIAPGATNNLVVLTVADMTASALTGVTITYTAGWNGTVSDVVGNLMATNATWVIIAPW